MTEESKNEETLRIEISHFASSPRKDNKSKKETKEENLAEKTMKISIERKNNKKSIINVNVNENELSGKESSDNIQIKIEKNNSLSKKEKKELNSSPIRENPSNKTSKKKVINTGASLVSSREIIDLNPAGSSLERKDARGSPIKKGLKNYKVSFIDTLTKNKKNIVDYIDVESYKQYNVDMSQDGQSKNSSTKCCGSGCNIL
jgi:hypothetical protein